MTVAAQNAAPEANLCPLQDGIPPGMVNCKLTNPMTRRSLLLGAVGAGTTAIAYPCFYEPRWLEATERRVRLARAPLRGPIRVLHLADLHASLVVPLSLIQNAITLGLNQVPDLICLTGDFITFRHDFDSRAYVRAL